MPDAPTPRQVFDHLIGAIGERRWHLAADLYAPDAVVDLPFALLEPVRLEGRDAVRAHFARAAQGPFQLAVRDVVVHDTADPDIIVAEFGYDGRVVTTGREFSVANIQVLCVRDGLIAWSRDYHDHAALAAAVQ